MPDPTTAAELHALVELWPKEARPTKTEIVGFCWHVDTLPIPLAHAIDLHIASGIKWLIRNDHSIEITKMTSGRHAVASRSGLWSHSAPTLLIATHAAIVAAKESST